jgi:hypothetical protein
MIEYWLGGTHNVKVDRQLAAQLEIISFDAAILSG